MQWRLPALRVVGTYLRHAPDHPGRWRLIDPAVRLAPALRTVTSPMTIRVREGFEMLIDGSSQTGRMLYATGEYESETSLLIQRLLKTGDTMIDVGANIGYFSILGARTVGASGRVFAFEPMPRVRERLERNVALNHLANVMIRSEALSDAAGPSTFYAGPTDDTGLASLRPLSGSQQVDVMRARFDDIWNPAERVTLVKIDVEGAEMAVIRGMSECLTRDAPHLILEVTDDYLRVMGASAESLVAHLLGFGYSMYRITNGPLVPISRANHLREAPPQFNAIFTKADVS